MFALEERRELEVHAVKRLLPVLLNTLLRGLSLTTRPQEELNESLAIKYKINASATLKRIIYLCVRVQGSSKFISFFSFLFFSQPTLHSRLSLFKFEKKKSRSRVASSAGVFSRNSRSREWPQMARLHSKKKLQQRKIKLKKKKKKKEGNTHTMM